MKELTSLCLSTTSLEVFSQCPRLFRHRYLESDYVAISTDPALEQSTQWGIDFHRLVELLTPLTTDREKQAWLDRVNPPVSLWWQSFVRSGLDRPAGKIHSELPLWITLGDWKLHVRIDRLVITPDGAWQLWDWKTGQRPAAAKLKQSWQVRLYPLVLCLGAAALNHGVPPLPDRVSMHFWFAQDPDRPFTLSYSAQHLAADREHLLQALDQIVHSASRQFPKINQASLCSACFLRYQCWGKFPIGSTQNQLGLFTELESWDGFSGDLEILP